MRRPDVRSSRRCAADVGLGRRREVGPVRPRHAQRQRGGVLPAAQGAEPAAGQPDRDVRASGAVAGVIARTDATRGVWKAPAGLDATLNGVPELSVPLTDGENGQLNPLGINCLRAFPASAASSGARARCAAPTGCADEWKYIPVRRTGAVPRGEPVPRHAVGGVRAQRRAAVGADPAQRRRVHATTCSARARSRARRRARPTSSSATRRRRPRPTSTSASSTSSSASRRSSRPSSSSSSSSRSPAQIAA